MPNSDLPEGWTSAPLAKVTRLSKEKWTPGEGENRRYLSLEHIEAHTGRLLGHGSSDEVKSAKNVYAAGDVLYGKLRPYLSKVVRPDAPGVCSTDILVFKPSEHLENGYLSALLQSHAVTTHAMDHAKGINLPRVSPKALGTFETPVPPLPEQRRIVARLDAIEAHRRAAKDKLDRLPDLLDRYRQSVLAAAFRGDLTADWREAHPDAEPASALLDRVRAARRRRWVEDKAQKATARAEARDDRKGQTWTEADRAARLDKERAKAAETYTPPEPFDATDLPGLPNGWMWSSLGEMKDFSIYGPRFSSDDYSDAGVSVLRTSDIDKHGRVDVDSAPRINLDADQYEKYALELGDLLITRTGSIGTLAVFNDTVQAIPGAYLIHYRVAAPADVSWYLYHQLTSPRCLFELTGGAAGTGRPNLNAPTIDAIPLALPPAGELRVIRELVEATLARVERVEGQAVQKLQALDRLRQATLARAFRGELVPTDADLARRPAPATPSPGGAGRGGGQGRGEAQTTLDL